MCSSAYFHAGRFRYFVQIRDEILNLDVNNLTPIEALNKLNDIKKIVRGR